jgi:hypothetical protein
MYTVKKQRKKVVKLEITYTDGTVKTYSMLSTEVDWFIFTEGDHVLSYKILGETE